MGMRENESAKVRYLNINQKIEERQENRREDIRD